MATGIDAWLGRTETQLSVIAVDAVARLSAVLDRDDPLPATGDPAPPLTHWLAFLAADRQSELGPDGHLKRGGFLPALEHLPRRMWAGSRIRFHGDLPVGVPLQRVSTVADVKLKSGKAGELAFVTVRHEIGEPGAPAAVTDEHDIVYRGAAGETAPMPRPAAEGPWRRTLLPDSVLLFRYSALTFNGHRIHYDRSYARDVEAYPGLVVHGPLTATLLADLLRREVPDARVASLAFRAVAPLFDGHAMHLNASGPGADGRIPLWASNHLGELAMSGEAEFAP